MTNENDNNDEKPWRWANVTEEQLAKDKKLFWAVFYFACVVLALLFLWRFSPYYPASLK